jgi:hypothetical protein
MQDTDKETLNLAYEMIVPAYDWSLRRIASVERRIDRLIALIVTVTVAFPVAVMVISRDEGILTSSLPLTLASCALGLAAFAVSILIYTRQMGHVQYTLPSAVTQEEWLSAPAQEFRQGILEQAGKAIDENRSLTNRRSYLADWMTGVFGMEVLLGLAWGVLQYNG